MENIDNLGKIIYILVCSEGNPNNVDLIGVYDNEKMAMEECNKRNMYEFYNHGSKSDWVYEIRKHGINSIFWKL